MAEKNTHRCANDIDYFYINVSPFEYFSFASVYSAIYETLSAVVWFALLIVAFRSLLDFPFLNANINENCFLDLQLAKRENLT